MRTELPAPPSERQIHAALQGRPAGAIIAIVHSKVSTVQGRRAFEEARRALDYDHLVRLAAQTLTQAAAPPERGRS